MSQVMTQEEALQALKQLKLHKPFRKWFAIQVAPNEWEFRNTRQRAFAILKKTGRPVVIWEAK